MVKTSPFRCVFRILKVILVVLLPVSAISGCESSASPAMSVPLLTSAAEPVTATMQVRTSETANLVMGDRAVPIRVSLLQLADSSRFTATDFSELQSNPADTLGPALLNETHVTLAPGGSQTIVLPLHPQTRVLGVVAGYGDIGGKRWRTTLPVDPSEDIFAGVRVNNEGVSIDR